MVDQSVVDRLDEILQSIIEAGDKLAREEKIARLQHYLIEFGKVDQGHNLGVEQRRRLTSKYTRAEANI